MLRACRTAAGVAVQLASLWELNGPAGEGEPGGTEDTEHVGRGLGMMAMVQPRHSGHEVERSWKDTETA